MTDVKSFFDAHAHDHSYYRAPNFYHQVASVLKNMRYPIRLLDLGCGNGSFIKTIIQYDVKGDYFGVDFSGTMLYAASQNLRSYDVNLILGDGFCLPLKEEIQFDLIHLDSVLHHLVGKTRRKCRDLVDDLLVILTKRLSDKGFIVVEEFYYGSYLIPTLTADIVFYALKLINFLKLDLRWISKMIIPGLEVSFYSEKELHKILRQYGKVRVIKKEDISTVPVLNKLFLQKAFGHISFIVERDREQLTT